MKNVFGHLRQQTKNPTVFSKRVESFSAVFQEIADFFSAVYTCTMVATKILCSRINISILAPKITWHPQVHCSNLCCTREIHPLEPQRHRHSMLAPRVCAPRVTRCSLGHVIWSVQLACSILSRSDSCQGGGRQRHLMMHGQCLIPVYSSQGQPKKLKCIM